MMIMIMIGMKLNLIDIIEAGRGYGEDGDVQASDVNEGGVEENPPYSVRP